MSTDPDALAQQAGRLSERVQLLGDYLDPAALEARVAELEQLMGAGDFWDDQERAAKVSAEHARQAQRLAEYRSLSEDVSDLGELAAMAREEERAGTLTDEFTQEITDGLARAEEVAGALGKHIALDRARLVAHSTGEPAEAKAEAGAVEIGGDEPPEHPLKFTDPRVLPPVEPVLTRAASADFDRAALGLRLRYLSGGMSDEARTIDRTILPERAGYFLGAQMVEEAVQERGIAWALRADAQELMAFTDAAARTA